MKKDKIYKSETTQNISNLRIVSMNPGYLKGLPDDYFFINYLRGLLNITSKWVKLTEQDFF